MKVQCMFAYTHTDNVYVEATTDIGVQKAKIVNVYYINWLTPVRGWLVVADSGLLREHSEELSEEESSRQLQAPVIRTMVVHVHCK